MNITPHAPTIPIPTVANPATEALRRENHQREVITQPAAVLQSAAEKGVASERERAKSPAQQNEQVDFSEIQKKAERQNSTINDEQSSDQQSQEENTETSQQGEATKKSADKSEQLDDPEIQREIKELKQRDREVRTHEQAHASVGGATTGAPTFTYEIGPDGKKYAVEGEVSVDVSVVSNDPRATIRKMQNVYKAALAPVNPSAQDRKVANSAARAIVEAQSELLNEASGVESEKDQTQVRRRERFDEQSEVNSDNEFDQLINQTLASQEEIAPSRTQEVDERALRIESFYANINQAYERPAKHQFELTA